MPRRRTVRRGLAGTCVLGALAAVAIGLASLRWYAMYLWRDGSYVSATQGALVVSRTGAARSPFLVRARRPGFRIADVPESWRFDPDLWFRGSWRGPRDWYCEVPLWAIALVPVLPAWLLLRAGDGKGPWTHCPGCGYDLAGNISGVCPECGQGATA